MKQKLTGKFVAITCPKSVNFGKLAEVLDDLGEKLKVRVVNGRTVHLARGSVTQKNVYLVTSRRSKYQGEVVIGEMGDKLLANGETSPYLYAHRIGHSNTFQLRVDNAVPVTSRKLKSFLQMTA